MAQLSTAQDQALRAARAQAKGAVGARPLHALLDTIKDLLGIEKFPAGVKTKLFSAQTSTSTSVVGAACTLYGVRVESGLLIGGDASNDVIVQLLDGTVVIGTVKCKQDKAAEAYFYAGDDGVGIPVSSSGLNVKAVQAGDGSSNPSSADRPNITVFYGV